MTCATCDAVGGYREAPCCPDCYGVALGRVRDRLKGKYAGILEDSYHFGFGLRCGSTTRVASNPRTPNVDSFLTYRVPW